MKAYCKICQFNLTMSTLTQFLIFMLSVSDCFTESNREWLTEYRVSENYSNLEKIAVNENSIYIGGKNILIQLNSTLHETCRVPVGPVNEHKDCPPEPEVCSSHMRTPTDNQVKVLEINPTDLQLLVCGNMKQGLCSYHSLNNITINRQFPEANRINYVGGKDSVVAYFGKGYTVHGTKTVLFTAATYDGRPMVFLPQTVSSRLISLQNGQYNMSYAFHQTEGDIHTYISITDNYRNFLVHYIYGFVHEKFSYFIIVQKNRRTNKHETRLASLCSDDPYFHSYMEVPLNCGDFNIAQVGYLYSNKLYVAFGKSVGSDFTASISQGSQVCAFNMAAIRSTCVNAQKKCYNGQGLNLMEWFLGAEYPCSADREAVIDNTFCWSRGFNTINSAIQGEDSPAIQTQFPVDGLATAITVVEYGLQNGQSKTVVIIGTNKGKLLKVLLENTPTKYMEMQLSDSPSLRIEKDLDFDKDMKSVYLLSGSKLTKFPLYSCRVHNDCSSCVRSIDPLNCRWCSSGSTGYCATQAECKLPSWSKDSCPPSLYSFSPNSGPNAGGTLVTLEGQDLGSSVGQVEVTVAGIACSIDERNTTRIMCSTGSRTDTKEFYREVKVTIVDGSKTVVPYEIRGYASSTTDFYYKDPKTVSATPLKGPKSGGTRLEIMGQNLDIGSNCSVTVANISCENIQRTSDKITCSTAAWYETVTYRKKRQLASGPIITTIDKAKLEVKGDLFIYKEDPDITDIEPKKSFQSGGLDIKVYGQSLDIVQHPQMGITAVKDSTVSSVVNCTVFDEGKYMTCPSPNLTLPFVEASPERPLLADVWFIMDDVEGLRDFSKNHASLAKFSYFPDPVYFVFEENDKTKSLYEENKEISIKGKYLNLAHGKEAVSVVIDEIPCDVTELYDTVLKCSPTTYPDVADDEPRRNVTVKVGNLEFVVGYILFTRISYTYVMVIGIALGIAILLLLVAFVVVYMKRNELGPFKPSYDVPGVYYEGDRAAINAERERFLQEQGSVRYARTLPAGSSQPDEAPASESVIDDETWLLIQDSHLLIDREELEIDKENIVGQGHFGCVFRGILSREEQRIEVAVKTLHSGLSPKEQDLTKFLQEALIMKDFNHPNVLELTGICVQSKSDMPLVILPFMKHGDLLSYIRNEDNNPTVKDLIMFAINVAEGMAYLSELKFVHRDLAARNCMLADDMVVKVADFGLSRDVYERDYYSSDDKKAKLPVKWMALESLEKGVYSTRTDVWSYGVLLWELMTRGVCPYPDVDNWDIIRYLKSGRRLPQPAYCPVEVYDIMKKCWSADSHQRSSFSELVQQVTDVVSTLERKAHGKKETSDSVYVNVPTNSEYIYPELEETR